jgi:hypothetical protein
MAMRWFDYFVISLPEIFCYMWLVLTLFRVSLEQRKLRFLTFSVIASLSSYFGTILLGQASLKTAILLVLFIVLIKLCLQFRLVTSVLLVVFFTLLMIVFQMVSVVAYVAAFRMDFDHVIHDESQIRLLSVCTSAVVFGLTFLVRKFKLSLSIPISKDLVAGDASGGKQEND